MFVVDDDPAVRDALSLLLDSVDLPVEVFESAATFLHQYTAGRRGCLILDVRMPGMSGLELQRRLAEQHMLIPIIILTAHADVAMARQALRAGALDFIEKPCNPQDLLDRIQQALLHDTRQRQQQAELNDLRVRFALLSPREYEVLQQLAAGRNSKQIGAELGISATTVDFHRRNLSEKLQVETSIELGRLFEAYQRLQSPDIKLP